MHLVFDFLSSEFEFHKNDRFKKLVFIILKIFK